MLVGPVGRGQCIVDVADRHHPGLNRNAVARHAARIAAAIELFMVSVRNEGNLL
jgi:hypothetical protein